MKHRRIAVSVLLMIFMICGLTACGTSSDTKTKEQETTKKMEETVTVRVGALKGPTSMGLLHCIQENSQVYKLQMETDASTLLPLMVKGELDIALLPANVAATLYQKMNGEIQVIDINTENVLSILSTDTSVSSIKDLEGKTIYLTGKGTTPDYVLQYLLKENGVENVTLEYKSEASEVAAVLAGTSGVYGLLPQPFATSAMVQNPDLSVCIDMGQAWKEVAPDSSIVTGVTVVRSEFLKNHPEAVQDFMKAHEQSAKQAVEEVDETAKLVVEYGILPKEEIAKKAIPNCGITYIDGDDMKQSLSGYLEVLHQYNAESVGGELPGDDFYYEMEE